MESALGAFRQVAMAIWLGLPDCPANTGPYSFEARQIDWKGFSDLSDAARGRLKTILNPEILNRLSKTG